RLLRYYTRAGCVLARRGWQSLQCEAFKPMIETGTRIRRLVVVLVVVTKYDKEGYLIQFYKGVLPCNTLAAMWSLTEAAFASSELSGLLCRVVAFNERTTRGGVNALRIIDRKSTRLNSSH